MKKFLLTVIFTVIPVVMSLTAFASIISEVSNVKNFTDVDVGDVEVLYLATEGIVTGNPDLTVAAEKPLNRAEALAIFARMFDLEPKYDSKCTFPDVSAGAWYAPYVSTMCNTGLVKGYPDGEFKPGNQLNKAEAMAILVRGLKLLKGYDIDLEGSFEYLPDDVSQTDWYAGYANFATEKNFTPLLNGYFNGGQYYTRGDLFVDVYRTLRTEELGKDSYSSDIDPEVAGFDSLISFSSDAEFDTLFEELSTNSKYSVYYGDSEEVAAPESEGETSSDDSDESITNVQEEGVDEGGIVKTHGDHLVVLRRGFLYTINLEPPLSLTDKKQAFPEGLDSYAWYDEMLVYENKIVVIGYSYAMEATEIEIFEISDDGNLTYKSTHFLDSNDYYSSRNYASRLVDNQLLFYSPHYIFESDFSLNLPGLREWRNGELGEETQILDKTDIYKPVEDFNEYSYPTLHTVVRCDLDESDLECEATAVLGPYPRTYYVSANSVYIWVSDPYKFYEYDLICDETIDCYSPTGTRDESYVYKMDLDDETVTALKAYGQPIDQFSFKEEGDNLNVLLSENSWGDGMWNSEFVSGQMTLVKIPLNEFSSEISPVPTKYYTALPTPDGYNIVNKFVGNYVLYGESANWWNESVSNVLYAKNFKDDSEAHEIQLTHAVDRIETMDDGAVVIGADGDNLKFTSIELALVSDIDTYLVENSSQGELRSHGFFYKDYGNYGILGLPINTLGEFWESYFDESSQIIYLKVNSSKEFSYLGTLSSSENETGEDNCTISCVDWYGNSRPIFYQDKIYALLGYELIEGEFSDNIIEEIARLNFFTK